MNLPTVIFLLVCTFLLGIAAGGYVSSLRQGKNPGEQDKKPQADDLIRLRKDDDTGALEVFLTGKAFRSPAEMSSSQRALAGYALNDLKSWFTPPAAPDPHAMIAPVEGVPVSMTATTETVVETTPTQPDIALTEQPEDLDQSGILMVDNIEDEDAKKRKRGGIVGMLTRALSSDISSSRRPPESIANQVNRILQEKLKDTPLEERGICLMELPDQEMVVMIGLDKYDSVSAVPDDEIRAIIQSAVNVWLTRSTA